MPTKGQGVPCPKHTRSFVMETIVELVKYLAESLVDKPEAVKVILEGETIKLNVDPTDMGKVIGKQGRIAKSLRSIVRSAAIKNNVRVTLDIVD